MDRSSVGSPHSWTYSRIAYSHMAEKLPAGAGRRPTRGGGPGAGSGRSGRLCGVHRYAPGDQEDEVPHPPVAEAGVDPGEPGRAAADAPAGDAGLDEAAADGLEEQRAAAVALAGVQVGPA